MFTGGFIMLYFKQIWEFFCLPDNTFIQILFWSQRELIDASVMLVKIKQNFVWDPRDKIVKVTEDDLWIWRMYMY